MYLLSKNNIAEGTSEEQIDLGGGKKKEIRSRVVLLPILDVIFYGVF